MPQDNVIRFGKARKSLARKRKEQEAAENRVKFGRTKAEKKRDATQTSKSQKHVDDHKRET